MKEVESVKPQSCSCGDSILDTFSAYIINNEKIVFVCETCFKVVFMFSLGAVETNASGKD